MTEEQDNKPKYRTVRTAIEEGQDYPQHLLNMYAWIEDYIQRNHYPPTNREVVDAGFAASTSVVRYYYGWMKGYGMLEVIPKISRGLVLFPRRSWKKNSPRPFRAYNSKVLETQ